MKAAEQIANDLRALRGDRTRETVAADLHISVSAIAMYENGERIPRDEVKIALAAYYGKSVGDLFFGEECHEM